MQPWTTERGTLWAAEKDGLPPPVYPAPSEVNFREVGFDDIADLTAAMEPPDSELIKRRLQDNRRCFSLRTNGQIAAYGWVTHGLEIVGELERQFNLHEDEAYVWDCRTVPAWRGRGFYSYLLNQSIQVLFSNGVQRIWIGASDDNRPSIRGFANAGFEPVLNLTYRRFLRLTVMRFRAIPSAKHHLVSAAYRLIVNDHERRYGSIVLGYKG